MSKKIILAVCVFVLLVPLLYCGVNVKADSAWTYGTAVLGANADDLSVAYDAYGNPHIAYHTTNNNIMYASLESSGWVNQTVDTGLSYSMVVLAIGSNNIPYIAYFGDTGILKCAHLSGQTWKVETVDQTQTNHSKQGWASIAIDTASNPHILYITDNFSPPKYASLSSSWSISQLPDIGGKPTACSLTLDKDNVPHAAFIESFTELEWGSAVAQNIVRKLYYATPGESSSWFFTEVGVQSMSRFDSLTCVSLVLDSNENPCIFVGGNSMPSWYASWTGSQWIKDSPKPDNGDAVSDCSLVLDSNDKPHISFTIAPAYTPYAQSSVTYFVLVGAGWSSQGVDFRDGLEYFSAVSLHLDSSDNPIIYYCKGGDLSYACLGTSIVYNPLTETQTPDDAVPVNPFYIGVIAVVIIVVLAVVVLAARKKKH